MKCRMLISLLVIVSAVFSQSIKIVSPNGGEIFDGGQEITITYNSDQTFVAVKVFFSCNNGTTWDYYGSQLFKPPSLIVPHLKKGTDSALIKLQSIIPNTAEEVISGHFTVRASPPDAYEPNDDFNSARLIDIGDSIVKNAVVIGIDSSEYDDDFYKVTLPGNRFMTITLFSYEGYLVKPQIWLYDTSGRELAKGDDYLKVVIEQSGDYYLKVSYDDKTTKSAIRSCKYGVSIDQSDIPSITLVTPKGGESFSAEQSVPIEWQTNFTASEFRIQYSIDSGKSWRNGWCDTYLSSTSYTWRVPHLKHGTDRALIKVFDVDNTNPAFDISNGTFTILPSPKDAYEPNDDFASARAVEVGDSVVKNAMVLGSYVYPDSTGTDTSLTDVDFFKMNLTAGKLLNISAVTLNTGENIFENMWMGSVSIRLYDASKNQIKMGEGSLDSYISQSGVYYCEISTGDGSECWNSYSLSIRQNNPVVLVSPNGGDNYQAGQKIAVNWKADTLPGISNTFSVHYSLDNGTSWNIASQYLGPDSWTWTVPALNARTDQALLKVVQSSESEGMFDISNGPFTIQAALKDAYEPNDDISFAYPIALGDSVVKNASTSLYKEDTTMDVDYYKLNLVAGSLVLIRDWCDSVSSFGMPGISLSDTSGQLFPINSSISYEYWFYNQYYTITQSGIYFIKVSPGTEQYRWVPGAIQKYGLSIKSLTNPISRTSMLDSSAMRFDSASGGYSGRVTEDIANISIDFMLRKKYRKEVTTMVLAPIDFAPLPDEIIKVKVFAIGFEVPIDFQRHTDVVMTYAKSDLKGYPEKSLAVACKDNSLIDYWYPLPSTVDTVRHQITIHAPSLYFNFFQVYVKSDTNLSVHNRNNTPAFGITTALLGGKQSIALHLSLPTAANADVRLYDIQGRCVRKGAFTVTAGSSILQWNIGGLANGKYFLCMNAGSYRVKQSMLIMN